MVSDLVEGNLQAAITGRDLLRVVPLEIPSICVTRESRERDAPLQVVRAPVV